MDEIQGRIVTLRVLRAEFFGAYQAMFSPTVRNILHVPDVACELAYLHDRMAKVEQGKTVFYCIFEKTSDQLIGAVEIRDDVECRGQLYTWINEQFWGGGRYQEALALIAKIYFRTTQKRFFTAHVDVENQRSYYALRKFGFAHAGFVQGPYGKQHIFIARRRE